MSAGLHLFEMVVSRTSYLLSTKIGNMEVEIKDAAEAHVEAWE